MQKLNADQTMSKVGEALNQDQNNGMIWYQWNLKIWQQYIKKILLLEDRWPTYKLFRFPLCFYIFEADANCYWWTQNEENISWQIGFILSTSRH